MDFIPGEIIKNRNRNSLNWRALVTRVETRVQHMQSIRNFTFTSSDWHSKKCTAFSNECHWHNAHSTGNDGRNSSQIQSPCVVCSSFVFKEIDHSEVTMKSESPIVTNDLVNALQTIDWKKFTNTRLCLLTSTGWVMP